MIEYLLTYLPGLPVYLVQNPDQACEI